MGESRVNMAALIGSRICHDLISPIGAIANGIEMMALSGGNNEPEMSLISDSVENAGARIRFFRVAYGAADGQTLAPGEVRSILSDLEHGGARLKVAWDCDDPHPRGDVQMAFVALQCLETAMPFGGDARVACPNGRWTVSGQSEKLTVDPRLWDSLSGDDALEGITPAAVQFALLPILASESGRRVSVLHESNSLTLQF